MQANDVYANRTRSKTFDSPSRGVSRRAHSRKDRSGGLSPRDGRRDRSSSPSYSNSPQSSDASPSPHSLRESVCTSFVMIVRLESPLLYDIIFIGEQPCIHGAKKSKEMVTYVELDNTTCCVKDRCTVHSFKALLYRVVPKSICTPSAVKKSVVDMTDTCDAVFLCRYSTKADLFGKVMVDLTNPLTGENVAEWIVRTNPSKYALG